MGSAPEPLVNAVLEAVTTLNHSGGLRPVELRAYLAKCYSAPYGVHELQAAIEHLRHDRRIEWRHFAYFLGRGATGSE